MCSGSNLFFAQNYAKPTADKRKKFLDMRLALKSLSAQYDPVHMDPEVSVTEEVKRRPFLPVAASIFFWAVPCLLELQAERRCGVQAEVEARSLWRRCEEAKGARGAAVQPSRLVRPPSPGGVLTPYYCALWLPAVAVYVCHVVRRSGVARHGHGTVQGWNLEAGARWRACPESEPTEVGPLWSLRRSVEECS
ncbi:hypothetical protein NDU88_001546 [Pleurodeles waltl]|uniref:Uncharacterized protein n=1 Tax=Pleurodeles waltl TaxID=8319 RepID=A0AAV7VX49_PLEWA|nr:hypothetical protein NDU88_001546 [Pleurodeles waltl]